MSTDVVELSSSVYHDVESIVGCRRPLLVHVEVNPWIPPDVDLRVDTGGLPPREIFYMEYSSSVGAFQSVLGDDYVLLSMLDVDALFLRSDLVDLFPSARQTMQKKWLSMFFCRPGNHFHPVFTSAQPLGLYDFKIWSDPMLRVDQRISYIDDFFKALLKSPRQHRLRAGLHGQKELYM